MREPFFIRFMEQISTIKKVSTHMFIHADYAMYIFLHFCISVGITFPRVTRTTNTMYMYTNGQMTSLV